jgi:hypothetical protein
MNPTGSIPPPGPERVPQPARLNWIVFLALLLGPAAPTSLAAVADHKSEAAPGLALIGGVLCGIGCGILLGRRLGRSTAARVILSLVFSAICAVACITIAMFGCLASGYQFMH